MKHIRTKLALVITVGVAFFAVAAYAASTVILAVGTIPDSQLFGGPARVTA